MSSNKFKCGIIGFGKMGQTRAKAIHESGHGEIKKVFDVNRLPDCEFPYADTEEEIINDPEIDVVFLCTPNFRIQPLTIALLEAGKHVFSEKPPAFNAAEVEEVIEAEKKSGKKLMYGFNHRHHGSIKRAKQIVDSGEYGRILWMRGRYGKSVDRDFFKGWRADKNLVGGGIFLDQGIHMLDLFLHFAGDFHDVQAMVSDIYWNVPGIEDNVFANFRNNETGVVASLHSTMTQWRHLFSLEIFMEKGHIVLNGLKTSSNSYGNEEMTVERNRHIGPAIEWGEKQVYYFENDTSWLSEIAHFFDCVSNDRPIQQGCSEDALRLMKIVDRVYAEGNWSRQSGGN
ncbi:Gfo/Idh/MocA family protein [Planctomicrobium sp. SH668]|uniref:Gfo/Idh/MocA family protein n=1 Tax=Planctomicrobium sp. SH668 TaxID=3448126 RepID=UPI003F5BA428